MKICLIIPTLNEEKNIIKLFHNIKKTKIKLNILFVDDDSSDQTQKLIISLKKKFNNINYLFRKNKIGIGSAHKDGIKFCYKKKYDLIITMDADGTHDPKFIHYAHSTRYSLHTVLTALTSLEADTEGSIRRHGRSCERDGGAPVPVLCEGARGLGAE